MTIGDNIYNLRRKSKMSQEEFAELFGVSRQAVQKWENNASLPEITKLMEISKHFAVSIDSLLMERNRRTLDDLRIQNDIMPNYEKITSWEFYGSGIEDEYKQAFDEGLDIEGYKSLFEAIAGLPQNEIKKELADVIQKIVNNAPYRNTYKYVEPSTLNEIKELRKAFVFENNAKTTFSEDNVYGAWMGRTCGCMLGKTVEGIRTDELIPFLKETGNYPMTRYITSNDLKKVDLSKYNFDFSHREYADNIAAMPIDDDTNYTVLSQIIFEKYGKNFTAENVADAWLKYQAKDSYCTAERIAFCNLVKGYLPPQTAIHKNPYREWIGAQIRADYWGYINPGNPERAAEMAYTDASISHIKNGIYGEMFIAASIAAAAETTDIKSILLSGLGQIPHTSRLYEAVMSIIDKYENGISQKQCFNYIHSQYNEFEGYGWCHTIPNAMIVAAALLYGNGDFGTSVCMAVETGFDTDCNGATVGSILGMSNGIKSIDKKWSTPFCDTLKTSIFGVGDVKLSEMAKTTMKHIEQNR